jgi:hypothetical protein
MQHQLRLEEPLHVFSELELVVAWEPQFLSKIDFSPGLLEHPHTIATVLQEIVVQKQELGAAKLNLGLETVKASLLYIQLV